MHVAKAGTTPVRRAPVPGGRLRKCSSLSALLPGFAAHVEPVSGSASPTADRDRCR